MWSPFSSFVGTEECETGRNLDKIRAKIPGDWNPCFFPSALGCWASHGLQLSGYSVRSVILPGRYCWMQRLSQEIGAPTCLVINTHPGCYITFGKDLRWMWGYDGGRYYNSRGKAWDYYWTVKLTWRGKSILLVIGEGPIWPRWAVWLTVDDVGDCFRLKSRIEWEEYGRWEAQRTFVLDWSQEVSKSPGEGSREAGDEAIIWEATSNGNITVVTSIIVNVLIATLKKAKRNRWN